MSSVCQRGAEKRRCWQDMRIRGPEVGSLPSRPMSPKHEMEQEKRMRREIANSNERRRMQSINSGFQTLKAIIPHQDGEKLSKAAILQHASDYIYQLEQDKADIIAKNNQLQQMLRDLGANPREELQAHPSPPPKRKKRDTESSDEGIGLACGDSDEHTQMEDSKREVAEIRAHFDLEHKRRDSLEETKTRQLHSSRIDEETHENIRPKEEILMEKWDKSGEIEAAQTIPHPCSSPRPVKTEVPATPFLAQVQDVNSCLSLSRRNLDTIVQAIRHLEGDRILTDHLEERSVPTLCTSMHIPNSEESGTESSFEDSRSDVSSGRDSPGISPMDCDSSGSVSSSSFVHSSTVHVSSAQPLHLPHHPQEFVLSQHPLQPSHAAYLSQQHSQKYQIPSQLLQSHLAATKCPDMQLPQLLAQPSVIVKRS